MVWLPENRTAKVPKVARLTEIRESCPQNGNITADRYVPFSTHYSEQTQLNYLPKPTAETFGTFSYIAQKTHQNFGR
jgi:hypothetical protein